MPPHTHRRKKFAPNKTITQQGETSRKTGQIFFFIQTGDIRPVLKIEHEKL